MKDAPMSHKECYDLLPQEWKDAVINMDYEKFNRLMEACKLYN